MKEAPAPAADESATRGVSPPGAPPTSPSTVTSTTAERVYTGPPTSPPSSTVTIPDLRQSCRRPQLDVLDDDVVRLVVHET